MNKIPELQSVIDAIAEPYVVLNRDYEIILANQAYAQRLDMSVDSLLGRNCLKTQSNNPLCSQLGDDPLQRVFQTGSNQVIMSRLKNDRGGESQARVTVAPIMANDGVVEYVGALMQVFINSDFGQSSAMQSALIGKSKAMITMMSLLHRVAPTQTSVLLEGESGVGKECVAHFVHQYSARSELPFIVVDCGALGETLIESELFGHERGAFTGATQQKKGLFEAADKGTLFIDEIGEMPLELQTKLLRVLETGAIRRVGGTHYQNVDVRVIAATNRNLIDEVKNKRFRQDLYYRLAAFPIKVPALRERKEDIPLLAEHFLNSMEDGEAQIPLQATVNESLMMHDYSGNVRELRNIVERAVILAAGAPINPEHLVFDDFRDGNTLLDEKNKPGILDPSIKLFNRRNGRLNDDVIVQVLTECRGHRAEAAQLLGVSERTLYRHIKRINSQGVE